MVDFFMFSWGEVLTSLRLLFVIAFVVSIVLLSVVFIETTVRAVSYGRVLRGVVGKVIPADYWLFIKHCYRYASFGATSRWENGSYWKGVGNWGYVSKKNGKWISKGNKR